MSNYEPSRFCECGHQESDHVYYTGACRPGFMCGKECEAFTPLYRKLPGDRSQTGSVPSAYYRNPEGDSDSESPAPSTNERGDSNKSSQDVSFRIPVCAGCGHSRAEGCGCPPPKRPCTYDPAAGECWGSCRHCEGYEVTRAKQQGTHACSNCLGIDPYSCIYNAAPISDTPRDSFQHTTLCGRGRTCNCRDLSQCAYPDKRPSLLGIPISADESVPPGEMRLVEQPCARCKHARGWHEPSGPCAFDWCECEKWLTAEQCGDVSEFGKVCVRAKGHTGVHKGVIETEPYTPQRDPRPKESTSITAPLPIVDAPLPTDEAVHHLSASTPPYATDDAALLPSEDCPPPPDPSHAHARVGSTGNSTLPLALPLDLGSLVRVGDEDYVVMELSIREQTGLVTVVLEPTWWAEPRWAEPMPRTPSTTT